MQNTIEHQAVLNLLHLGDEDIVNDFTDNHSSHQFKILTEKTQSIKSNTVTIHRLNFTTKVKTEGEVSAERNANSTQNKENLKKILAKLRDSPSPAKKKIHKKRQIEFIHIKTLNSEPQSRSKEQQKTLEPIKNSLNKIIQKERERQLIKSLVKAKIVEKLKNMQEKKTQRQLRQESFRISTLREIPGLKRGQMALHNNKDTNSYHNIRGEPTANLGALLNGKNSQVNLKHLLF